MTVHKMRKIGAIFKVDSTFVKKAPTVKTYRVIENSETCIKIHCTNKTTGIPYSESFDVIDILTLSALTPDSKCCILQIGMGFVWHKSTMMKGTITKGAIKAALKMNENYKIILSQFPFEPKTKPDTPEQSSQSEDSSEDQVEGTPKN